MHPIKMTVNQIEPVRMSRYELKQGGKARCASLRIVAGPFFATNRLTNAPARSGASAAGVLRAPRLT